MENNSNIKKFNFKKIGTRVLSLVLVFGVFISCFVISASAQSPLNTSLYEDYSDVWFNVGYNNAKNAFYYSGFDSSLNYGYTAPNLQLSDWIYDNFSWNRYQSYMYLPATDTSVSGKYIWSGRLWFSQSDNSSDTGAWQNKPISYYQRPFYTIPKGYDFSALIYFSLPNVSPYSYNFIGSNFHVEFYSSDYSVVTFSNVELVGVSPYIWRTPSPWDTSQGPTVDRLGSYICLRVNFTSLERVDITSMYFSIDGISTNYGGLLIDNFVMLTKCEATSFWAGAENIILNSKNIFTSLLSGVGGFFNSLWTNIYSAFSSLWMNISSAFTTLGDRIGGFFNNVYGYFGTIIGTVQDGFIQLISTISQPFLSLFDAISSIIYTGVNYFIIIVRGVYNIGSMTGGFS